MPSPITPPEPPRHSPPPPRILLYDWDNTLVDAWGGVAAALNAAFAAFAMPPWSITEVRERVRVSLRESFPPMFGPDWRRAADVFYTTLAACHLDHVRPMPGAAAALAAGAHLPQGVVSNKTGPFLRAEVAHLGWAGYFGPVIGAGDASADKPDPAPILMALAALGHPPGGDVWYMGDTALDMQAARAAGVSAILIGDAGHDGGIDRAAPDLHFCTAHVFSAQLGAHAQA